MNAFHKTPTEGKGLLQLLKHVDEDRYVIELPDIDENGNLKPFHG